MTAARRIEPWISVALLMALIFFLSAQEDLSTGLGTIDLIARKFVHAGEFGLLCFLWWRALRTTPLEQHALSIAAVIAVLYAVSDEFHQGYVNGRHASPIDVLIDSTGVLIVALLIHRRSRRRTA